MVKNKNTGFRIEPELYEKLKNKADQDHRTVSNVLRILIESYVSGHTHLISNK